MSILDNEHHSGIRGTHDARCTMHDARIHMMRAWMWVDMGSSYDAFARPTHHASEPATSRLAAQFHDGIPDTRRPTQSGIAAKLAPPELDALMYDTARLRGVSELYLNSARRSYGL